MNKIYITDMETMRGALKAAIAPRHRVDTLGLPTHPQTLIALGVDLSDDDQDEYVTDEMGEIICSRI